MVTVAMRFHLEGGRAGGEATGGRAIRPGVVAETRYWIDRATGIVLRSAVVAHLADGTEQATTTWEVETLQRAG